MTAGASSVAPVAQEWKQVREVASSYRQLIVLFTLYWGGRLMASELGVPGLDTLIALAGAALLAFVAHQLAERLRLGAPWLWPALFVSPALTWPVALLSPSWLTSIALLTIFLSVMALLSISQQATRFFQARGIRVGLIGPNRADLERVARPPAAVH